MTQILHQTDHQLKTAVTDELGWTPNVNADRIAVSVDTGAVTLSGQVETYPEKTAAMDAAMRVIGVTAIADEITVKNSMAPREDSDIAREAADALDRIVYVPAGAVKAAVRDHAVTLTGNVSWDYQREATRRAMEQLRGVRAVFDKVTLTPEAAIVTPEDAKAKITAALMRNARMDASRVKVSVDGTGVEMTGSVSSWAEFRQAGHAAWSTPGVTRVENRLLVTV
jgi:osmotically-inducible protein OsmY